MTKTASKPAEKVERKTHLVSVRAEEYIVLNRLSGRIQGRTGVRLSVADCLRLLFEDLRGKKDGITAELLQVLSEAPDPAPSFVTNTRKTKSA